MKPGHSVQLLFVLLAAIGAYSFVRAARDDHRATSCRALCALAPAYAGHDRLVPDFELVDMSGRPTRLSEWWGQPIVLNFWSQHCEPCLKELPSLAELAAVGAERGIAVVSVSADEGPEDIRESLRRALGVDAPPFTVLFDPELEVIQDKFGTTKYPETWIIDSNRIIRARFDGDRNWSSGLALDVIEMTRRPWGCPIEFDAARPVGRFASWCER